MNKKSIFFILLLVLFKLQLHGQNVIYKYDNANRLVEVMYADSMSIQYKYDADGNRISQAYTRVTATTNAITPADSSKLSKSGISVYPNPNTGSFSGRLFTTLSQNVQLEIYNMGGQLVYEKSLDIKPGIFDFRIEISPLPPGTYILKATGKTISAFEKVLILN